MDIQENLNQSWFKKLSMSVIFGFLAFILSMESPEIPKRWWQRCIECAWFIVWGFLMGLLFGDWVEANFGRDVLGGFIGGCCFLQKPMRLMIFKFLEKVGADPLNCLERLVSIWRRK